MLFLIMRKISVYNPIRDNNGDAYIDSSLMNLELSVTEAIIILYEKD